MILAELYAAVAAAKAKGHEWISLSVPRKRPPRSMGGEGRLWSGGPRCRFIGEVAPGRWLVVVRIADLEPHFGARVDAATEREDLGKGPR